MTAREYCYNKPTIAYASMLGGVEIKGIDHGSDSYIYAVSNAWYHPHSYHHVKIHDTVSGRCYFVIHGQRVYLDEYIRCN